MTDSPKLITLFTDAGYCPFDRVGVWAAWAKVDGQAAVWSGVLRGKQPSSGIAELRALVNGVMALVRTLKPPAGSKIIAQTDCQFVIRAVDVGIAGRRESRELSQAAVLLLRKAVDDADLAIEMRHVSGHKGVATPRFAVNTLCDRECRRLLKAARRVARAESPRFNNQLSE